MTHGGVKSRRRSILGGLLQKYRGKQGGGYGMRDTGSMIQGNGMEAEWEVGILGQILVTPRWVNDLVW